MLPPCYDTIQTPPQLARQDSSSGVSSLSLDLSEPDISTTKPDTASPRQPAARESPGVSEISPLLSPASLSPALQASPLSKPQTQTGSHKTMELPNLDLESIVGEIDDLSDQPTAEELVTLRRVPDQIPKSAYLVAIVELCERFTYYGLSGPFQNYIQNPREGRLPGALGLGQQKAVALLYFFQFWCYLTPIFGAIIADSYWGKYKTIFRFALIDAVGVFVLVVSSLPWSIANGYALPGLIVAMVIIGLGTGGIKSNVSPLIGEQYRGTRQRVAYHGAEKVIVDPAVTIQTIFMIFYYCINIGCLAPIITSYLEMKVDFWAAYLVPFLFFFVGIAALVVGKDMYYSSPVKGSVIPDAVRVCWMLLRGKEDVGRVSHRAENIDPEEDDESADSLTADSAAAHLVTDSAESSAATTESVFVDDIKAALKASKVFLFYPIYWLVYGQMTSNFISQAGQMKTYNIPNDIMSNIDPITLLIFIPIVEKKLYPALRRRGILFGPISRIYTGFMCAGMAMLYASFVQYKVYSAGPCYDSPVTCPEGDGHPNDVSVFWQIPAYILIGFSEIFASVTGLEYAFTNAPASMKSLVMSIFLLTNAGGYAMGIFISPLFTDPYMVRNYFAIAVVTLVSGVVFKRVFDK